MYQVTLLRQTLQPYLGWHGARLSFLAAFLIAVFRVKTVNLAEVATAFTGKARCESNYKRLQRFFRQFELDYVTVAKTVVGLMKIPQPWVLTVDRTQWNFGSTTINILMLGIAHNGVAFPLLWTMLDKKGNSNTTERICLLEKYLDIFPVLSVACVTADREFVGKEWLSYLHRLGLKFRLRIRHSDTLSNGRGKAIAGRVLFAHLPIDGSKFLPKRRRLWGHWVYVSALRLVDGCLLIVASSDSPATALSDYAQRWQIETLFGCFKSRGFCLESTHLAKVERLSKLLALLTLALCWASITGEWLHSLKPLKIKKHGRKAKSLFRSGFDYLRTIFFNLDTKITEFHQVLQFLSCT